jgi:hypothetical protein
MQRYLCSLLYTLYAGERLISQALMLLAGGLSHVSRVIQINLVYHINCISSTASNAYELWLYGPHERLRSLHRKHTRAHTHMHMHTHTRTPARTHARTHAQMCVSKEQDVR